MDGVDLRYGGHPRQTFDFLASRGEWRGTLAYYHAGYWQARDKSLFRFLAAALAEAGLDVAVVNYPLCPDVTMPELIEAVQGSVPAVLAYAASIGRGGAGLIAAGHSAGAHIAAELALGDWPSGSPIIGVAGLSGVYDLEPLVGTALNDKLRLTPDVAREVSPVHRVGPGLPPALFVVGGLETPAFQAQSLEMHAAWTGAGNLSDCIVVTGEDHFSLLCQLVRNSATRAAVLALAVRA